MAKPNPNRWTSDRFSENRIADYKSFNFVDGEGVRCSLYVSGCLFACKGCYNKKIQSFSYGKPYTKELEDQIIQDLHKPYCQGLTLLGGEPFLNTGITLPLVKRVREEFGSTKDIWSWTGYSWDELMEESLDKIRLLSHLDILVDGRFELSKLDLNLQFRGSSNQRIIDVPKSLDSGQVILWEKGMDQ